MDLSKLKIKKLMNELNYLKSDIDYKQEMLNNADKEFLKELNSVLDSNDKLKESFEEKENIKMGDIMKEPEESESSDSDIEEPDDIEANDIEQSNNDNDSGNISEKVEVKSKEVKSKKVKSLYREIVKLTHPDKVNDDNLNRLYLEATDGYDNNDIFHLYLICDKLDINYSVEDEDMNNMDNKVSELKSRSNFLESTFTWKWLNGKDDLEKKKIIIQFINMKLNM